MPIVSGYISDWTEWNSDDVLAERLDILNYAFATIDEAGYIVMPPGNRDFTRVKARNPRLSVLLSIGGWGADGFSQAALTEEGRERFAKSAVAAMRSAGLDGLDIDWEYPGIGAAGIAFCPEDTRNFTLLLHTLRSVLTSQGMLDGRRYLLTIAVGATQTVLGKIELGQIHSALDYINVMTYDMRGYEPVTGHHTNLCSAIFDKNDLSADLSVRYLLSHGVPAGKIVIGAAFYGRTWANVPDIGTGLRVFGGTPGPTVAYKNIVANYYPSFTRHFDIYCKAPYLFNGNTFVSYDDPESLGYKARYAHDMAIGGVMFWEYTQDTSSHELLIALSDAMRQG